MILRIRKEYLKFLHLQFRTVLKFRIDLKYGRNLAVKFIGSWENVWYDSTIQILKNSDLCQKSGLWTRKFFSDFKNRNYISVLSYERRNIIFYDKNLKLWKSNYCNNVFCNWTFSYYRFLPICKKNFNFVKSWPIFSRIPFSTTLLNLILKIGQ